MKGPTNNKDTRASEVAMSVPLLQAVALFTEDYLWAHGYTLKTQKNYKWAIDSLCKVTGNKNIDDFTISDIHAWRHNAEANHWEHNAINSYLYRYRTFFRFFAKQLNFDPEQIIIPKMKHSLPKFLTFNEVTRLMQSATTREKAIVALLYSSAIRVGELVQIRIKDINGPMIKIRGKGDKERIVMIDEAAHSYVDSYLSTRCDTCPFLFCSKKGGGIGTSQVEKILRDLGKRAKIAQPVYPHLLRHTAATLWLKNGMNLRHIQELLGHADISTTQIYTHVVVSDLQDSYSKYHKSLV